MVHYDSVTNPYALPRLPVHAAKGMIAASQPLAAQAGLRMLEQSGNAVDAAVASAAVLDASHWRWLSGRDILVEPHFPRYLAQQLAAKGHNVRISMDPSQFGRGQIIWRNPQSGVLTGGIESRTDGMIAMR